MLNTAFHPVSLSAFLSAIFTAIICLACRVCYAAGRMAGNPHPLTVYGPQGVREFIATTLRLSGSWTDFPLQIEEISAGDILDDGLRKVTAFRLGASTGVLRISCC
ncbi:ribonuclease Z [Salmonella enterica subsp. enterica]|nr:ribonuclease Z [Salmonella enterica subsp. enterica] [Salmonella enterica subsp. enterica serovar Menston]